MNKVSKNTQPVAAHGATGYQGNVKIAVFKGKRQIKQQTVKNNGTNSLFLFLCECLGAMYNRQRGPTGIQLKNAKATITNPISVSRAIVSAVGGTPQVALSFVVPFSAINTGAPEQTLAGLSLVNSESGVLAEVDLETDSQIKMSTAQADYSLNIDWIMSFTNVAIAS